MTISSYKWIWMLRQASTFIAILFIFKNWTTPIEGKNDLHLKRNSLSSGLSKNAWQLNSAVELEVYISEQSDTFFNGDLVWKQAGLQFGSFEANQTLIKNIQIPITKRLLRNETGLYAHVFFHLRHALSFPDRKAASIPLHYSLVNYHSLEVEKSTHNLLFDQHDSDSNKDTSPVSATSWYPTLHIQWVADNSSLRLSSLSPPLLSRVLQVSKKPPVHLPIAYVNDFWHLRNQFISINSTLKNLPLRITVEPISWFHCMMAVPFGEEMRSHEETYGISMDDVRQIFVETNPILLIVTFIVSLLHTCFDWLAFTNDIRFWNRQQNHMEGISARSVLLSTVSGVIIFLYLLHEKTNWLVLFSAGVGVCIEFWKITKAYHMTSSSSFPWFRICDRSTYAASPTKVYDDMAVRTLLLVCLPLLVAYAGHALLTQKFTNWYSFILKTLVSFVYVFGFVLMTPQLFINYKLKSVAALPWKTFTYKALNTFIDDLFAFIIKMPTLHRIACLRDDVVFLVLLYQYYLYPVDRTRPNEYGQVSLSSSSENDPPDDASLLQNISNDDSED